MKKFLTGAIIVFTMLLTAVGVSAQVNVVVDGEKLELKNEAFIEDGRTLIPVRAIFEALDAKVLWFEDRRLVVAFSGNSMLQIGINSDSLYVNDDEIPLDVPARIVDDRTYIPLRAVSEALGAVVDWNDNTRTATIDRQYQDHFIKTKYVEDEVVLSDGKTVVNVYLAYPEIENPENNEKIAGFNTYVKDLQQKCFENIKSDLEDGGFTVKGPNICYFGYEVVTDKNNLLSVLEEGIAINDEGYGNVYSGSMNYNLSEDAQSYLLLLEDLLNVTEKDFDILSLYNFHIDGNRIYFVLDSSYVPYAQEYGLSEEIYLECSDANKKLFKIDITTGETLPYGEPVAIYK